MPVTATHRLTPALCATMLAFGGLSITAQVAHADVKDCAELGSKNTPSTNITDVVEACVEGAEEDGKDSCTTTLENLQPPANEPAEACRLASLPSQAS